MEEAKFNGSEMDAGGKGSRGEGGDGVTPDWGSRLHSCIRDLRIVNVETEKDYLETGSNLRQFQSWSRDIADVSSAVSGAMAGGAIVDTISGLRETIERARTYIDSFEGRLRDRKKVLEEALEMIDNLDEPVHDLKGIIKNMKYLSLSTRIHSARIDQDSGDFMVLAGDIKKLSEIIETKSAEIRSNLSALSRVIDRAVLSIEEFQRDRGLRLNGILADAATIIGSLSEKHELSKEKAESISRLSVGITENIGEIVEAVQFHDITRQQFDHVGEVLARLVTEIEGGAGAGQWEGSGLVRHVGDVCDLQLTQIDHAREQLVTSIGRILGNLKTVSGNAHHMLDEAGKIVEGDGGDRSFLYEMERGLVAASSALISLSDNVESNRVLYETMGEVNSTAARMTSFTDDMDEIESEIEVIALNASVKAAKIGESGMALGVVAQMMQKVSVRAHVITATISQFINTIRLAVKILSSQINTDEDMREAEVIRGDLDETLRSLRELNDEIGDDLGRIAETGDVLSESIRESTERIRGHDMAGKALDRVIDGLKGIVDEATHYSRRGEQVDTTGFIDGLTRHYSMKSEHTIHRSFVCSKGNGGAGEIEGAGDRKGGGARGRTGKEYGDNVELF